MWIFKEGIEEMGKLEQYINEKYDSANDWFVQEVDSIHNQEKVLDVLHKKEYLSGKHSILNKIPFKYNGKVIEPKKIILQYAKTLLNFQSAYLLQNPITLTGNDKLVKKMQKISRKGKYNRLNMRILDKVLKYGQVYEYVYVDKKVIKSKLIGADEGFPVYDENNEQIAFIEAFISDGINYYIVYTPDYVTRYDNNGGELRLVERFANLSGLPIVYHNDNELSDVEGRSELDDWISLLDNMESILSKYAEATEKFLDPIFINVGQQLKGEGLPADMVGKGINLDDGGNAFYLQAKLDKQSFETLYKTLQQALLDISSTPAVSMNKTDISNLSEVSIKLLFQLADIKAGINQLFMKDGIDERFEKIRELLELQGVTFSDDVYESLDIVFKYATPSNDKEVIENIAKLREIGGISLESMLSHSPYTTDVQMELDKIDNEGKSKVDEGKANDKGNQLDNKQG